MEKAGKGVSTVPNSLNICISLYAVNEENIAENVFSSMETRSPGIKRIFIGTNTSFLVRGCFLGFLVEFINHFENDRR